MEYKKHQRVIYRPDLLKEFNEINTKIEYDKYDVEFEIINIHPDFSGSPIYILSNEEYSTDFVLVSESNLDEYYVTKEEYLKIVIGKRIDHLLNNDE